VGFHFEETLVARKSFRGASIGRKSQASFGFSFDFSD